MLGAACSIAPNWRRDRDRRAPRFDVASDESISPGDSSPLRYGTGSPSRNVRRDATIRGMARKSSPRSVRGPATYERWKAHAVDLMGGDAGAMPDAEWRMSFMKGHEPARAAKRAASYDVGAEAHNPKRRRR